MLYKFNNAFETSLLKAGPTISPVFCCERCTCCNETDNEWTYVACCGLSYIQQFYVDIDRVYCPLFAWRVWLCAL